MRKGRLILTIVLTVSLSAGCLSGGQVTPRATEVEGYGPAQRAVTLETEGCGFAADRIGSGVAIGDGLVITVAHLIVEASDVRADVDGEEHEVVTVVALDRRIDLAVLRVPSLTIPAIAMGTAVKGAHGSIIGGATSGTVAFEVEGVVELTIEEVFGTARHARSGYQLAAGTSDGDSGAGAYDEHNRLIGIVFATGQEGKTTWVTASSEIEDFIAGVGPSDEYALCE